jgi:phosphoribosylanthranilate isomerase
MVKVKICGITNLEDALAAVEAGCDALGFVFYKKSPRYISPVKAQRIIRCLPAKVIKIGVFVNAREKFIKDTAYSCGLDMLQFHGRESPQFCRKFKDYRIIKAIRIKNRLDLRNMLQYKPFAYLLDKLSPRKFGGTGERFDWKSAACLKGLDRPVFLAGGLTCGNVLQAIKTVRPEWVDASSSLESSPGKKSHSKLKSFIKTVKRAEH